MWDTHSESKPVLRCERCELDLSHKEKQQKLSTFRFESRKGKEKMEWGKKLAKLWLNWNLWGLIGLIDLIEHLSKRPKIEDSLFECKNHLGGYWTNNFSRIKSCHQHFKWARIRLSHRARLIHRRCAPIEEFGSFRLPLPISWKCLLFGFANVFSADIPDFAFFRVWSRILHECNQVTWEVLLIYQVVVNEEAKANILAVCKMKGLIRSKNLR